MFLGVAGTGIAIGCTSDPDESDGAGGQGGSGQGGGEPGGCDDAFAGGEYLGDVDFLDGGVPFHEKVDEGWDARLYFDLTTLSRDKLTATNDEFYIRTELPDLLDTAAPWEIQVHGLAQEATLTLDDILPLVKPQGAHVLECSGNGDGGAFGLMSAAEWAGAPIEAVLDVLSIDAAATRVLISGFDEHSVPSAGGHSTPGASWIFTFDELIDAGAFLATEMNGEPLPPDHGAPVRLYVPGWYGCTNIKWVDEIELVDEDASSTSQMREFASRTHQDGTPMLARDFRPATMDQAAMPVRIEKWRLADGIAYRVVGILWGGQQLTDALRISFDGGSNWESVDVCPSMESNQTWTLWEHLWRPAATGTAAIQCAIDDPEISTNRLDLGWYDRAFTVEEL
jgi:DMSO/TMAO reductase YedYZ molybdopterin-dependent catalytic subunit